MSAIDPSRAPPPPLMRRVREDYLDAYYGLQPAEALPTHLRWRLIAELHRGGWSDVEIAEWTRLSTYTVGRIRGEMGLRPNPRKGEGVRA